MKRGRREVCGYTGTHEHCICMDFQELESGNQTEPSGLSLAMPNFVAQAGLN